MTRTTTEAERNMDVLRCLIEEGFGKGNLAALDEVVAPQIVEHQPGLPPSREGLKAVITELRRIFPDLTFTIEDMTADGDKVWGLFKARGTWRGDMFGKTATGQTMEIAVMDVIRVEDGKLVEHWGVPDRFHQLEQLGLLPTH
jgi:predicted ester cyclase